MPDATLAPAHDDCVYAAGVYDGEGWVTVTHRVRRERHYYTAVAGLSNSDRQVLEWHRERWGGWVMGPKTNRLEQSETAAEPDPECQHCHGTGEIRTTFKPAPDRLISIGLLYTPCPGCRPEAWDD